MQVHQTYQVFCETIVLKSKNWHSPTKQAQNRQKSGFLMFFVKILSLIFCGFGIKWKFTLLAWCVHKSDVWENFDSWVMGQDASSQWNCRILKLATFQGKIIKLDFWNDDIDSRNKVLVGCGWNIAQQIKFRGSYISYILRATGSINMVFAWFF